MPLTKVEGPSANTITTVNLTVTDLTVTNLTVTNTTASTLTSQIFTSTLVAGETLALNDVVYVEPTLTSGTAGRVYKMDADVLIKSTQAFFVGFATASAAAAANVAIQTTGVVSGFTGLTVGALYYASTTAGGITATKPPHPMPVGMAISATQLLINIRSKREAEESENVSAVYGYMMGGLNFNGAAYSYPTSTERITFSTGIYAASTVSNISEGRFAGSGFSDTQVFGYINGGYNGSVVTSTCDRIAFATSVSTAYATGALTAARYNHFAVSDGTNYGYTMGGYNSGFTVLSSCERTAFNTGVSAAIASTLSQARLARLVGSVSDGAVYGYAMGGTAAISGAYVTTTDRITFSTSAIAASTISNLSQSRYDLAGVSDGAVYGYAMGGTSGAGVATADRITFSTSVTAASTAANLSTTRLGTNGLSDGAVYGYISGGTTNGSNEVASTDRIIFSTSITSAATSSSLSRVGFYWASSCSDGAV